MSIRHNCETQGCFIKVATVDWGFLDNSFSGKIRVGDIDGIVEANGNLLIMEWKRIGVPIPKGQEIMFFNITKVSKIIVFVVNGDAITNIPESIKIFHNGSIIYDDKCDANSLHLFCKNWEMKARKNML